MMTRLNTFFAVALVAVAGFATNCIAEKPQSRELVFEDSFQRSELVDKKLEDKWLVVIKHFGIEDGKLIGREDPDRGHGSVVRAPLRFKDAVIDFKFRLTSGKNFNLVINDKNCKAAHAGHVSRVSISPKLVRIADDREGAMKNEIFAMLKDKSKNRRLVLKDREKLIPQKISTDQWHAASVSIIGETISVTIDGKEVGALTSSGIAHPTKTDFGFTVIGERTEFDDVKVWKPLDLPPIAR